MVSLSPGVPLSHTAGGKLETRFIKTPFLSRWRRPLPANGCSTTQAALAILWGMAPSRGHSQTTLKVSNSRMLSWSWEHYILPEAWGTQDVFKEHAILVTFITLLTLIPFKQKQHMTTASHPPVSTQLIASEGPQELRHLMALNNHRKDSSYTVSSSSCHPRTHSQVSDPCCRLQLSTRYFSVALPIR